MIRTALAAALALLTFRAAAAQTIRIVDAATLPRFEVASVRPGDPQAGERASGGVGGGYRQVNMTLESALAQAFGIDRFQLPPTLPDIAGRDIYTIQARGPAGAPASDTPLMLRALLIDRFKLQVHVDTREEEGYALTLARRERGPGERLRKIDDCPSWRAMFRTLPPVPGASEAVNGCGLPVLGKVVSNQLRRPVVERTGLEGLYGFDLKWSSVGGGGEAPSFTTALQEQLGLKLEPLKMTVDHLVIDHIERPDPD